MSDKAIFLDRDGTLIVNRHYLADPADVELLPGVREALAGLLSAGYRLFLFTNQSGVGRGYFTMETVLRCNARMLDLLALPAPGFSEICIAPEAPHMPQCYRKPSPRFIVEMLEKYSLSPGKTWMVGDSLADVEAGLNAGVRGALFGTKPAPTLPSEVWLCRDLPAFCERLSAEIPA